VQLRAHDAAGGARTIASALAPEQCRSVGVTGYVEAHLGSEQVSRVIYGAIIGLALVVALEAHPPPAGIVVSSLLGTAAAVALADVYSEIVGAETHTRRRVDRARVVEIARDAAVVATGVAFPTVFFVLAAAGAMDEDTAFVVAKWSGVALIGFYGFAGARLVGDSLGTSLLHGLAVALIGALLIGLKALVH
jgi:hypothetical protein